ncbi:M1 family metallopeptidase [Pseudoalteromonas sp. MMG005]|uniref:M1 family metallopeptidase n=1 Tax=Pseudoalteromonas sp. MMG005 TaxID=2822682 RepID=UPI001B3A4D83|nr:M1 family metallopeptidase [Pseudoalteromonas sp. MMG005]MBQ4845356.1 M1 family metallopeptidase [Pseudoalteromonas sp. MMG005]
MFYKRLLALAISLAMQTAHASEDNDYIIEPLAKPSSQSVHLTLDPNKDTFSGISRIELSVLEATHYIEINGLDYAIELAKLIGNTECDLSNTMLKTGKVRLHCDQQLQPGKYTLTINFDAPYNQQSVGLYKTIDQGKAYLFTQFEMSDARRAFPVFDEPQYKIPFQLTITAPNAQKVYANTPLIKAQKNKTNTTHFFDVTPPIPSYLVAMAVGPFEEKAITGMPIPGKVITPQGKLALADYAIDNMPKVLKVLEDYFGIPYVYKKLDSVAVPEFPFGAMENSGLVTYREDILLVDPNNATSRQKQTNVSVIAHELAHQWYGNLVTMKWWNDLWLNEAFASWMAAKVTQQLNPEFNSHLDLPQNYVMTLDAQLSTKPIRKPIKTEADIMDGLGLAYSKGSAVLSMIENWIGADAFQKGMRAYMKKYAFKNAEAADLWRELSLASNKDVASVLSSFVEQSSFPLISVTKSGKMLTLSQQRFANAGVEAPKQLWNVPVTIKYGKGDKVASTQILLNKESQRVQLDFEPQWIYPDKGALGYYRWMLEEQQFNTLLKHAKSALSDRERLALLSAADALLDAGKINAGQLMAALEQFASDQHPRVASNAIRLLRAQKSTFKTKQNEEFWPGFIRRSIQPAIAQYGLTSKPQEIPAISSLRAIVIALQGFDGKDQSIITTAQQQTALYLTDSTKVDPYLAGTFLKLAAYHGNVDLLKAYQNAFETTKEPQTRTHLLAALSYFGSKTLQSKVLDYALTDKVTPSDLRIIFSGQGYTESRKKHFRTWIYENYAALSKKMPPFMLPTLPSYTGNGCEIHDLKTTEAFFKEKVSAVPGYQRSLEKVSESVHTCIALKRRELESVNKFLARF